MTTPPPASALSTVLVPIHRAGWPFIAIFALVAAILWALAVRWGLIGSILASAATVIAGWCVYFFRDPPRVVPTREGLIVSPADGLVQMIRPAVPPAELGMGDAPMTCVSIFLNVFNVHVNRIPIGGMIDAVSYRPGKFLNAAMDKASVDNERMACSVTLADGRRVAFVQIAGLVARRIICTLKPQQVVKSGERYGLIRFGSRTDVYLPDGVQPLVIVGQQAIGGETVLADLSGTEPARAGEIR